MRNAIAIVSAAIVLLLVVVFFLIRSSSPDKIVPDRPVGNVPDDSAVAAVVNGEKIMWGEVVKEILRVFRADTEAILDEQISETVVAQEANKRGVRVSDDEVETHLREYDERIRAESGGTLTLEKVCEQEGQTMDQIRRGIRMRIASEKLVRLEQPDSGEINERMIQEWEEARTKKARIRKAAEGLPPGIAAVVNGEEIPMAGVVGELLSRMARSTIEKTLDETIADRLVEQTLKGRGLSVTEGEVNKMIQTKREMLRQNPAFYQVTLEQALKSQGKTMRDLESQLRRNIGLVKLFEREIPEDVLRKMYEEVKDALSSRRVRASHIVAMVIDPDTSKSLGPGADAKAKAKIEMIRKMLDSGAKFEDLARKYSEDRISAPKGGDLGFFLQRGYVVAPVADAAFSMKKGEIRSPIKSKYGYHIVKVTDVDQGKSISFSEERLKLMVQYLALKENHAVSQGWLDRLRGEAKIQKFLEGVGRETRVEEEAGKQKSP